MCRPWSGQEARPVRACRGRHVRRVPRRGTARTRRGRAGGETAPDTRASTSGTRFRQNGPSSRPSGVRKQLSSPGGGDQVVEPRRLGRDDSAPEGGQLVIATALVVEFRSGAAAGFLNQSAADQLLDRSVESP